MTAILQIRLLGEFCLLYGDQPVTAVNTPRLQSLLAYLVLHRDAPQSRNRLAFQFWPDSTESQARTNLRKLYYQLHQALPSADRFLRADTHSLQWLPDAPFTLDVAELEDAVSQDATSQSLHKAIALYRGDLLPSCYEDWILPERERLQQTFMDGIERLVALLEDERNYRAAIGYAQRLLQHDPLHEAAHRHLMRLHALSGDRAAALRTYHACVTILKRELGVEPSRATREVYERLLSLEPVTEPPPGEKMASMFPLIGRQAEWSHLQAAWQSALHEGPRLVLISGEAGIGKTRLAEELLQWADRQGLVTASAYCYAAGAPAYAPVTAWLRARPLPQLDSLWLSETARLLPEILAIFPNVPPPGPLSEAWQRGRLFEALARAILHSRTIAAEPLLLLIEDLQWCDSDTLEWLGYLLRFDPRARLLVVGTLRTEEVEAGHPLTALLTDLRHAGRLTEIALGSLSESETAALAAQVTGQPLGQVQAADLYRETEGVPLFVIESLHAGLTAAGLPSQVQAVLAARLAQLSPPTRELAQVAAVIGRAFRSDVLAQASGVDEEVLVRGLDEMWQRRIVREHGGDAYDFSHTKLRDVAYASLSPAHRRWLHRRVAQAVETLQAGDLDSVSGQLANHYDKAGLSRQAIHYFQRAAAVAQRVYANTEAIACLNRALELTPETDVTGRYALLLAREKAYDLQGQRDDQARDLAALKSLPGTLLDEQRAEVALLESRYAEATSDYQLALTAAQTAIALAQSCQDISHEAAGYLQWGRALWQQGDYVAAHGQLEQALWLAQKARLPDVEADSLYNLAGVAAYQDDYASARHYAGLAHRLYRSIDHRQGELRALNIIGVASYSQGDYMDAETQFNQALHLSREIGERRNEGVILRNLGSLAYGQGDYARALEHLEQSLRCCRASGDRRSESETLALLGLVSHAMGDDATACENSQQAIHIAQSVGARYEEGIALACLGQALAGMGQLDEATDAYRQAFTIQKELGESNMSMEPLAGLARVALAAGNLKQALAHVEVILHHLEHHTLGGAEEPFLVYLTCYRILLAHHDGRARKILDTAYNLLQERAARITPEALQRSFLERVSAHREIVKAWERQNVTQSG